ncbi:MAG: NADH-quinone oxidoreductase subunit L [Deltaproteobacteria bacterium]|nr:NADH-quinone oxidoreductase subunit L [Deltaproteobacteria bacterium]
MSSMLLAQIALLLPLAIALFLMVVAPIRRAGKPAGALSVAGALVSLGASLVLFAQALGNHELGRQTMRWLPHSALEAGGHAKSIIEVGIHLDGLSVSMLVVVCFVAACVQIFSLGYMAHEPPADFGRYFTWQSLFLFAMNTLVIAPNLLQFFLGWELVGLASYLLIGFYYKKPSAARAALKAFWTTKFADMGLVAGLILLFLDTGSFEWTVTAPRANWVAGLLFIAVMGKSAQFPLHIWLPDAMEGPTPVSALLHAATMVAAGVFLVVRADPLYQQAPDAREIMAYIGGFTALFAACIAVVQNDIKKVLAYSTCSQLGYMVCALGAGSQIGGFFHLTTHAFFKAMLFLAAGGLIHAVHSNDIRHMGGLAKKMTLTSATFILGALALAGVPGLAGYFSKDFILEQVEHQHFYVPLAALLIAAFLTAFYMGRVVFIALFGEPSEHARHAHESGISMTLPLVMLAVPAAVSGYFVTTLTGLYAEPQALHFVSTIGGVASALALSGIGLSYFMFGAPKGGAGLRAAFAPLGRIAASGAVDRFWLMAYRKGLNTVAHAIGWFDRYIVDGLVNVVGYMTLSLGARLRPLQTGNIQDYLYAIVAAAALMGLYGAVRAS